MSTRKSPGTIHSLPIYGLDELFVAYGFKLRVAFGLPQRPVRAYRLVQTFACHVATSFLEMVEKFGVPEGDGVFVPSPCDTLNNLADILAWKPGASESSPAEAARYVGYLDFPEPEARGAEAYLRAEIARVKGRFLSHFGLEEDREAEAACLRAYATGHEAIQALYGRRRRGEVQIPAGAFARFLAEEPSIPRHELPGRIAALEELRPDTTDTTDTTDMTASKAAAERTRSLFVSGITLPTSLAEAMDGMGFTVVDDDLAQGYRRFSGAYPDPGLSLEEALARKFLALGPCSTTSRGPGVRAPWVAERVRESAAAGFVYLRYPWCEPEAFDAPPMLAAIRALGVPVTEITLNPEKPTEAATITRFEAFYEQLA
jgi:2-hydroxyglutaryl-CoA dehydratase D-component